MQSENIAAILFPSLQIRNQAQIFACKVAHGGGKLVSLMRQITEKAMIGSKLIKLKVEESISYL